jgi:hypothetical protein
MEAQGPKHSKAVTRWIPQYWVTCLRWIARLLAFALFVFWGLFFLEHIWEWFIRPYPQIPPPKVWVGQTLHFLILAGLVIGFRWELTGGLLTIIASVLFFADKAPLFILPTIVPAILYLYCWHEDRSKATIGESKEIGTPHRSIE